MFSYIFAHFDIFFHIYIFIYIYIYIHIYSHIFIYYFHIRIPALRCRRLEDVLKTCLQDVWKAYLEDVLKTRWKETKYLLGTFVSNKSKCVSNISIFHKSISHNSKANPKCINQNLIISLFLLF